MADGDYYDEEEDEWPEEDDAEDDYDGDFNTSDEDSENGQFLLFDVKDYDAMMQPGTQITEENQAHELGVYYLNRQNKNVVGTIPVSLSGFAATILKPVRSLWIEN